jgi:hypothetical protein
VSKPGTEVPARQSNQSQILKKKDRQASDVPENKSDRSLHEAMGTVVQSEA